LDIQVQWTAINDVAAGYETIADAAGQLAEAGATWVVFEPPGDDADHAIEIIREFGSAVISA
jgi:hypothetical protein